MSFSTRLIFTSLLVVVIACDEDSRENSREEQIQDLTEQYPRIDAGDIRIPPADQLTRPDLDVGGYCLDEEEAGHGSLELCLEALGRELLALGGTR